MVSYEDIYKQFFPFTVISDNVVKSALKISKQYKTDLIKQSDDGEYVME